MYLQLSEYSSIAEHKVPERQWPLATFGNLFEQGFVVALIHCFFSFQ